MAETCYYGPENLHTLVSVLRCILCFQRITFLRIYSNHDTRKLQAPNKNVVIAGVNESMLSLIPQIVRN